MRPVDQLAHLLRGELPFQELLVRSAEIEPSSIAVACRKPATTDRDVGLDVGNQGFREPGCEQERRPGIQCRLPQGRQLNGPHGLQEPLIDDENVITLLRAGLRHQGDNAPEVRDHNRQIQSRTLLGLGDQAIGTSIQRAA